MSGGDPKSARILQTIQWFTILLRLTNEMKTKRWHLLLIWSCYLFMYVSFDKASDIGYSCGAPHPTSGDTSLTTVKSSLPNTIS